MGGGTDAAGDASSVVLLGDRLGQLWEAVQLGRAAMAKIRQNLAWAGAPMPVRPIAKACGVSKSYSSVTHARSPTSPHAQSPLQRLTTLLGCP